ncbi:MAG: CPBP family intramembrane metalloprotease [Anaerolineaceae bacterium]|nr:CPBP family intramembrane metalloprotease [Anaerolineaceae bacterium]
MDRTNRNIWWFLAFTFGISWAVGLAIFFTGGLTNSPEIIKGTGLTLALVLLASVYMWGPAMAHIITRLITRMGWKDANLKTNLKKGWPFWLIGWFAPGLFTLMGAVVFFLVFPASFDPQMTMLSEQLETAGVAEGLINPFQYVIGQTIVALLLAPLLNLVAIFGEEFGWRAYLVPALAKFGRRKALILSGLIWGVWHWPVIMMGHNYGLGYPGFPWLGLLATLWFTLSVGIFFGWLSLKAESVWPAVFAHGALNGIAAIGLLFIKEPFSMLLGPSPAGLIGCLPFTIVSLAILLTMKEKRPEAV